MEYIQITESNIDNEHICCAMSNKQSDLKKEWLKERFKEGLVFYRAKERGKCFIEYIDAEKAWSPIDADGYVFINCLWVSGSFKGHGYSNDLLNYCIEDAKSRNKKGLCIVSSNKKKEFVSDSKYLTYKGFKVVDETPTGFTLMYLPFSDNNSKPKFKDIAKKGTIDEKGIVIYYSNQCPFTYYWVPREKQVLEENNIQVKIVNIENRETAINMPIPLTTYALFKDGKFITQAIQTEKKILEIANSK